MKGAPELYMVPGIEAGFRYKRMNIGVGAQYATEPNLLFGNAQFMTTAKLGYTIPF
jgi:hypothetical protein